MSTQIQITMHKNINIIDVFLSAPRDTAKECNAVLKIAKELNYNWERRLGAKFDICYYKRNKISPTFSKDGQWGLNKQRPESIDLYIAILWNRIGTPTARAESGTIEEFELAYNQYKEKPKSIDLKFYFKNQDANDQSTNQKQKVLDFKKRVGNLGALYNTFKSSKSFKPLIRTHLSFFIFDYCVEKKLDFKNKNDLDDSNAKNLLYIEKARMKFKAMALQMDKLFTTHEHFMNEHYRLRKIKKTRLLSWIEKRNFETLLLESSVKTNKRLKKIEKIRSQSFNNLSKFFMWYFKYGDIQEKDLTILMTAMIIYRDKLEPLILILHKSQILPQLIYKEKLIQKESILIIEEAFKNTTNEFIKTLQIIQKYIILIKSRLNK